MARVCFKQNAGGCPAQHTVEDADLPEIVLVASKLANDFDEDAGFHLSLDPLEFWVWASKHKVVAMDDASQVARDMLKATRAGFAALEAHQR